MTKAIGNENRVCCFLHMSVSVMRNKACLSQGQSHMCFSLTAPPRNPSLLQLFPINGHHLCLVCISVCENSGRMSLSIVIAG